MLSFLPCFAAQSATNDRRSQIRYPIALEIKCKPVGSNAIWPGKTIDMSSNGVRFSIDRELPVSDTVELLVKWPRALPETFPLDLVLGRPRDRCDGCEVVIQTHRYAFGTGKMIAIREPRTDQAHTLVA